MIGIFDSGLGGLTVARAIRERLPDSAIAYLGDTARTPYGSKGPETVIRYALEDAAELERRGASVLVVACHTMSSVAVPALRERFSTLPLLEVLTPSLEQAVARSKRRRIGVIATRATIASGVYQRELTTRGMAVVAKACPLLVPLLEEGWQDRQETRRILRTYLAPVKAEHVDTLVLGCTHYPLLRDQIQQTMGKTVTLIDPGAAVADALAALLEGQPELALRTKQGETHFAFTDVTDRTVTVARQFFGADVRVERARLPD